MTDTTKRSILNNTPIEENLHVVMVISNPCAYNRRYVLAKDFINRMELENNIILYIVELAYWTQRYHITDSTNKRHLQLRSNVPLWHKENMINLAVSKLLPETWKAFAWIDADIEFDSPTWALDALKILNGSADIIQLFSHAVNMNIDTTALNIFPGFSYQYVKNHPIPTSEEINYWHPGFGWAMTRTAYQKVEKLYEFGILGSGDYILAKSLINRASEIEGVMKHSNFYKTIREFQIRCKGLRIGYVPGVIRHHYHGTRENRRYTYRWKILSEFDYDPLKHMKYNEQGLLVPTESCSPLMIYDILDYFHQRKEDDQPFTNPS